LVSGLTRPFSPVKSSGFLASKQLVAPFVAHGHGSSFGVFGSFQPFVRGHKIQNTFAGRYLFKWEKFFFVVLCSFVVCSQIERPYMLETPHPHTLENC
jgi:hypothetical protein